MHSQLAILKFTVILSVVEFVASKLRTPAADIANVSDEWRLYIYDEEIRKPEKGTRVDHY